MLKQAITAIKSGKKKEGYQLLIQTIKNDPHGKEAESAWLWMATIVKDPQRKRQCLESALAINPNNETAKSALSKLTVDTDNFFDIPSLEDIAQSQIEPKSKSQEVEYLSLGDVLITSTRAVFKNKTYAMSNVTSVDIEKEPADKTIGNAMILFGIIFSLGICTTFMSIAVGSGLEGSGGPITVGLLGVMLIVGGVFKLKKAKPTYTLKLWSASGERNALISTDKEFIQQVMNAINTAIVNRG